MFKLPKDVAKEIRTGLKNDYGYNRNQVSVTVSDEAVSVTVKDPNVNCEKVKEFAMQYKDVDIDEVTGEILAGSNTYIFFENIAINPQLLKIVNKALGIIEKNPQNKGFPISQGIILNFCVDNGIIEYSIATPHDRTQFKKYLTAENIAKEITTLI
jgi:hypothetical protein